ncbi:hypothetical protein JG688_00010834 [Phytophthora aleatoria]|uniref:Uncharacterized protein n=1 Tax=Phytophthora aleatoria TaxID=2496075 RepID=A0A8J5J532_9STRA|nr:hypothetical protein JG688_00010834 [Phytophthora aleatoria]
MKLDTLHMVAASSLEQLLALDTPDAALGVNIHVIPCWVTLTPGTSRAITWLGDCRKRLWVRRGRVGACLHGEDVGLASRSRIRKCGARLLR